jgi:AbrB family looped-hinge helix DNA binding protein
MAKRLKSTLTMTVKVTRDKGRITIPIAIRRKLGMRTGDIFDIRDKGRKISVVPVKPPRFRNSDFAACQIVGVRADF